jgi:hypothetical protein
VADIDDITDEKSLLAWLNTGPQADIVAIAHRAALRVLSVRGEAMDHRWSRNADLTALPIVRCLLTSGVARKYPTSEVNDAARAAAASAAYSTPLSPPFPHLPSPPSPPPLPPLTLPPTQSPPQFGNK